ncbi:MAG: DUF4252 domain-containing protein [Bacteroidales bacterium]|nr:DUF4252 domain-containing protein [Bacteroidales bacterium]
MKNISMVKSIVLMLIFTGGLPALQAQSIMDKLYDKYSGQEGYTSVYISKYMFDMFRNNEANVETSEEMDQIMSKLNCIKILVTDDDPTTPVPVNLYNEIMKVIPSSPYKEIMMVKEKDQDIKFFVREEKGKVAELLMVIGGKTESVLISIQGEIDMKNISKLAKSMEIEGMDNLEKIE